MQESIIVSIIMVLADFLSHPEISKIHCFWFKYLVIIHIFHQKRWKKLRIKIIFTENILTEIRSASILLKAYLGCTQLKTLSQQNAFCEYCDIFSHKFKWQMKLSSALSLAVIWHTVCVMDDLGFKRHVDLSALQFTRVCRKWRWQPNSSQPASSFDNFSIKLSCIIIVYR